MWEFFQNLKFLILLQISKNLAEKKKIMEASFFFALLPIPLFAFFIFQLVKCVESDKKKEGKWEYKLSLTLIKKDRNI